MLQKYPRIGGIVMVAYGLPETEEEASNRGSLYYIEKPFEMNKLEDVIATSFELEKGFEGHIASIQLTDLIQLNCLRKATNALTVPSENQTIKRDWSYLLLEGVRRSDEVNRDAWGPPVGRRGVIQKRR